MGELRERMAVDLRLRGLSENTQKTYLGCVRQFAVHFGRSPAELSEAEIRAFLDHLARERKASTSTRHVYVGALHFLYRVTLGRPEDVVAILAANPTLDRVLIRETLRLLEAALGQSDLLPVFEGALRRARA